MLLKLRLGSLKERATAVKSGGVLGCIFPDHDAYYYMSLAHAFSSIKNIKSKW